MYMSTRANLDYWSTDNCCLRWPLRTGAITIGLFSLVWQSLMVMTGVMMLVKCPVNTTTTTTTNLTLVDDLSVLDVVVDGTDEVVMGAAKADQEAAITQHSSDVGVKCLLHINNNGGGGGGGGTVIDSTSSDVNSSLLDTNSSSSSNSSSNSSSKNSGESNNNNKTLMYFECPWLPDPETEVLGVYTEEKLFLVAGLFIAYSGIYGVLSLCVVVGSFTKSVSLLQGWVAFTGFHNMVILASLFVPLPFTTLTHLVLSIGYFILSLYTWAVVKSYMHALKVELNKPLLPEGSITDYTVDGVDVTEIPVQV